MLEEYPTKLDQENYRSSWRSIGSLIFLVFLILIYLVLVIGNSENRFNSDYLKFYLSARFLLQGGSIYTPLTLDTIPEDIQIEPELFDQPVLANINPPLLALLMSPFARINYPIAYLIWALFGLAFGLLSVYVISKTHNEHLVKLNVFELSIILLLFFPTLISILSGQISTLLLFLIVIAWISAREGKDQLSGIALGIALSLKIFTGLFIPVLMIQRRWKLVGWYLGTFFTLNLAALFLVGLDDHIEYLKTISSIDWYSATWNTSFMGFFTRIFGGSTSPPFIPSPNTGLIMTMLFSIITVITILWFSRKTKFEYPKNLDLIFSLTLVGMLLVSPLGWIYYYVFLIIPLVVCWIAAGSQERKLLKVLIGIAWLLCTIPYALFQGDEIRPIDIFIWSGFPLYGLLLFMIILLILFWNSREKSSEILEDEQI